MNQFITTSIPYMNGVPHIGHAMEMIMTDIFARYFRATGRDTFFLTGADEHGVKIWKKAQDLGLETLTMLDQNVAEFQRFNKEFSVSNDGYIRTTDQKRHWPAAQHLWRVLAEKGDLYKKSYHGNYCEGCEAFLAEKDLDEQGHCLIHKKPTTLVQEENWFFRLSRYHDQIRELIESKKLNILPDFRANEILSFLKEDLQDTSFSRSKEKMPWGIPVPGDEGQVMYVWCDALTNYLSGIGYPNAGYEKWWTEANVAHVIGKDISRFHAIIWIGMLLSAGLKTPDTILVHGFINDANGEKMSKSLGNVVEPFDALAEFGADAVRLYLSSEVGVGQDINYDTKRLKSVFNDVLANNVGNFSSRTTAMFAKNFPEGVFVPADFVFTSETGKDLVDRIPGVVCEYCSKMEAFDIRGAVQAVLGLLDAANAFLNQTEPWKIKEDTQKLSGILLACMEVNYHVVQMFAPVLPGFAQKTQSALGFTANTIAPDFGFVSSQRGSVLRVTKPEIVFQRKA